MNPALCPVCGAAMECGAEDPAGCWCMKLPPTPREWLGDGTACLCPDCLRQRRLERTRSVPAADD